MNPIVPLFPPDVEAALLDTDMEFVYEIVEPGEAFPNVAGAPVVSVDVETRPREQYRDRDKSGLDPWRGELLGVALGVPGHAWYFPLRHRAPGDERRNLSPKNVLGFIGDVLANAKVYANQNVKFDVRFMATDGLRPEHYPAPAFYDTMIAAHLIDEREPTHSLKPLAQKLLGMAPEEQDRVKTYLAGQTKDRQDWSVVPADVMAPYGCGDVERVLRLAAWQRSRLEADGLVEVFATEMRLLRAIAEAELAGVKLDLDALQRDQIKLLEEEIPIHRRIEELFHGVSVNPNSVTELADALVTKLGVPILVRKEPTENDDGSISPGAPSFDDAALNLYAKSYPQFQEVFWRIQQARRLFHCRTSFIEPMIYLAETESHPNESTLHYEYKLLSPRTGTRMSCENMNVQALGSDELWDYPTSGSTLDEPGNPVTAPYEKWLAPGAKQYIGPRAGMSFVFFDYSQIEYRWFAHYANAEKLIAAYRADAKLDMHKWAAEEVLEGLIGRDAAKHIHFGIVYGMGDAKLMKKLGVEEDVARRILNKYRSEVPELGQIKLEVKQALQRRGYLKTVLGRRRRVELNPPAFGEKKRKCRGILAYQGLNAICQGSAGDLLKDRVPPAHNIAKRYGGGLRFLVHDEFVFEIPSDRALEFAKEVKPILETFVDADGLPRMRVPIHTACKITATNWRDAKKIDLDTVNVVEVENV